MTNSWLLTNMNPIWPSVPVPTPDTGGDLATSRGTDPNVSPSGPGDINPIWAGAQQPFTGVDGQESGNSVSGLPSLPSRFAPAPDTPPDPPNLTDRNPGTIDQR